MNINSMEKDRENFQELRNMWSTKANSKDKPIQQNKSSKATNETIKKLPVLKIEPPVSPKNEKSTIFESIGKLPRIEERPSSPVPSPVLDKLQNHIQSIALLQNSVEKMQNEQKTHVLKEKIKTSALRRWNIARHVFRSGLIFNRTRRASDSIIPLLQKPQHPLRTRSIDSHSPLENLIDYISSDKNNLTIASNVKRSTLDAIECIRRNKLDDSLFQYEMLLRHLKNHEQFLTTHPTAPLDIEQANALPTADNWQHGSLNETELKFLSRTSVPNRQTQSLSRYMGRTFSEFIMNDLLVSSPTKQQQKLTTSHTSVQTYTSKSIEEQASDMNEAIPSIELDTVMSNTTEEAKAVLNELDTILEKSDAEQSIIPTSEVSTIPNDPPVTVQVLSEEQMLMKRLFQGKKTSFTDEDLDIQSLRIPEELMETYETAKKRCFFDSEQIIYATKMIKISRRGYTQHIRLLCLTTERLYNITKKDPYPKEGILFQDICGITVSPYQDGFMCIHTKETYEDRGDWLVVVDHPCEFITKYFMITKRKNNDARFLRFKTQFTHYRRCYGEGSSECTVEIHLSDSFRVKKAEYDLLNIFTT